MTTAESLYNAIYEDDIKLLTPGSIVDYGFMELNEQNGSYLFGSYKAISKFLTKEKFINVMYQACINNKLNETVEQLTNTIPIMFRNHWNNYIKYNRKINTISL